MDNGIVCNITYEVAGMAFNPAYGVTITYDPVLNACDARRGPYAPCVCCGRMTSCLMDPTMSGVVRPWCMWHALSDAGPVNGYPAKADRWSTQPNAVAWERQHRRLAGIARRRAASRVV